MQSAIKKYQKLAEEISPPSVTRVLDLFPGLGGFHYSLSYAGINSLNFAIDINPITNKVYQHNFSKDVIISKEMTSLPDDFFESIRFDMWMISPPCQPYTLQGNKLDGDDSRSGGIKRICKALENMTSAYLPKAVIIENVAPFAVSQTWSDLRSALISRNYKILLFKVSPINYGFPNERLRVYVVAVLPEIVFPPSLESLVTSGNGCDVWITDLAPHAGGNFITAPILSFIDQTKEEKEYLPYLVSKAELSKSSAWTMDICTISQSRFVQKNIADIQTSPSIDEPNQKLNNISEFNNVCIGQERIFGITKPHTICFTKAYGRYFRGTGSLLLTSSVDEADQKLLGGSLEDSETVLSRLHERIRYFTPMEIARLMGFKTKEIGCSSLVSSCSVGHMCLPIPAVAICGGCEKHRNISSSGPLAARRKCICRTFEFPDGLSIRQKYAMLGNSLNPAIVGIILRMCGIHKLFLAAV